MECSTGRTLHATATGTLQFRMEAFVVTYKVMSTYVILLT